jgi:hypothetical protein
MRKKCNFEEAKKILDIALKIFKLDNEKNL